MTNVDRKWITGELQSLLRALASPGEVALALEPEGTVRSDELALDYENFVQAFVGNFGGELAPHQRASLLRVDELFDAMSGPDKPELWTDGAVCTHPQWAEVRVAAQRALDAMTWSAE